MSDFNVVDLQQAGIDAKKLGQMAERLVRLGRFAEYLGSVEQAKQQAEQSIKDLRAEEESAKAALDALKLAAAQERERITDKVLEAEHEAGEIRARAKEEAKRIVDEANVLAANRGLSSTQRIAAAEQAAQSRLQEIEKRAVTAKQTVAANDERIAQQRAELTDLTEKIADAQAVIERMLKKQA